MVRNGAALFQQLLCSRDVILFHRSTFHVLVTEDGRNVTSTPTRPETPTNKQLVTEVCVVASLVCSLHMTV